MKNCISRRSFLKAVGILSAAGALAACGGSSSSSTAASSTASSAAASGTASAGASIKLWTYPIGGWGKDETVQELISSFNAKYPDIKVTVEYLDYTNGDDQVNTAIEGGSAPDLIMEGPERLVANWGKKGVMAPLHDLWTDDAKKDIYASVESACKNEAGDYYEYPLCMILLWLTLFPVGFIVEFPLAVEQQIVGVFRSEPWEFEVIVLLHGGSRRIRHEGSVRS